MKKVIGVLAIQGDFEAHIKAIKALGAAHKEIRNSADIDGVTHLIIPGGESTTIRHIAGYDGLWGKLERFSGPVLGTCMGSILMARKILAPDSNGWGMIDMTVIRNAYGRQINSFSASGKIVMDDKDFEMIFIRAPKIIEFGQDVKPVAWLGDQVTGVISGNKMALTFHPELTGNTILHRHFLSL